MSAPRRPLLMCVAGPSGSGKTTSFPILALGLEALSVDDRGAALAGSYWAVPREVREAVARECEERVAQLTERGISFAVETTLRTQAALEQAAEARRRGFFTLLCWVGLESPSIGFERVLVRAQAGGHGVPERAVSEIWAASLANLPRALRTFERALLFDGSAPWQLPRRVATARDGAVTLEAPPPAWLVRVMEAAGR